MLPSAILSALRQASSLLCLVPGAPSGPDRSGGRRNDKGYRDNHNRLRALVKEFRAANEGLEIGYVQLKNEVQHYQVN